MQVRGEKDYTSLVKGLITERSPILGEEQACQDELNFVFDLATGTRVKRKGFQYISGYTAPSVNNPVLRTRFHWADENLIVDAYQETVTHDGRRDTVFVFLEDSEPYLKLAEVYIPTAFTLDYSTSISISPLRERLFVTSGSSIIAIDKTGPSTLKLYDVELYIRDFKLIPDNLRVGQRTGALNDEHLYNLYNAGWYAHRKLETTGALGDPIVEFGGSKVSSSFASDLISTTASTFSFDGSDGRVVPLNIGDVFHFITGPNVGTDFTVTDSEFVSEIEEYLITVTPATVVSDAGPRTVVREGVTEFPSNADIPVLGLKADEAGDELFSKNTLANISMGNSEAPRGHYVYNITNIDRDSRISDKNNDGTPSTTVSFITTVSW